VPATPSPVPLATCPSPVPLVCLAACAFPCEELYSMLATWPTLNILCARFSTGTALQRPVLCCATIGTCSGSQPFRQTAKQTLTKNPSKHIIAWLTGWACAARLWLLAFFFRRPFALRPWTSLATRSSRSFRCRISSTCRRDEGP
jgi:hypothetical protein